MISEHVVSNKEEGLGLEVYLDNEASPKIPKEVALVVYSYMTERGYGNPSVPHKPGLEAFEVLYNLQEVLNRELFEGIALFLPGGTEANNLFLRSIRKGKLLVGAVEHESILYPARKLGNYEMIPVDEYGHIQIDQLEALLNKEVKLVSVQLVNQELGSINDIEAIRDVVRDKVPDAIIHVDACDGFLRVKVPEVDAVTISGSKIYAPRGSGVLMIREDLELLNFIEGSSSLQDYWKGGINIPALAGMLKSVEAHRDVWSEVKKMKDYIANELSEEEKIFLNSPEESIDTLNFSIMGKVEPIIIELSKRGVYVSKVGEDISHVLKATGKDEYLAKNRITLRISPFNTWEEIRYALSVMLDVLPKANL